jgi:hypothetical protein
MILIAGGTGTLGTWIVVRLLIARGLEMRLLTRDPARARHLEDDLLEVGLGMRGARGFCRTATSGAQTVISAIQGFSGSGGYSPRTVDRQGNINLIQAGFVMDTYDVSFDRRIRIAAIRRSRLRAWRRWRGGTTPPKPRVKALDLALWEQASNKPNKGLEGRRLLSYHSCDLILLNRRLRPESGGVGRRQ